MPRCLPIFLFFLILMVAVPVRAADGEFFHEEIAASAERYEQKLNQTPGFVRRSANQWKKIGDRAHRKQDMRGAAGAYAAAATLSPGSARS